MEDTEVKKERGGKTVLKIIAIVLIVLVAAAAITWFGVYRDVNVFVIAELGEGAPDAGKFIRSGAEASYKTAPDVSLTEEGHYFLTVQTKDYSRLVLLIVKDTQAPTAESADKVLTVDDKELAPEAALKDIYDASGYTAEWISKPDYGKAGVYECSILMRDPKGNERIVRPTVTVIGVVQELIVEAGGKRPTLEDFMAVKRDKAEFVTELDDIDWSKPGETEVKISFDGVTYTSVLKIVDTTAPVPDLIPAAVIKGGDVAAEDFVIGCTDVSEVTYKLSSKPDTSKTGTVNCGLTAVDAAGNTAECTAKLVVCDAVCEFEASADVLTQELLNGKLDAKYEGFKLNDTELLLNSLGAHEVTLTNDAGETAVIGIVVKDTTAPTAKAISCPCSTGYYCDAINFVDEIVDVSTVTAKFVTEPDWSVEGEQEVEIILTDRAGNETTVSGAKAVISPDKTPPVIYAARDRYLYVGEPVAYFKEVFAVDNADPDVKLDVDKSKVDYKTPGTYDVTYTAKDAEGNESSVTVKFTFKNQSVTDEKLNAEIDGVLSRILKDGMTVEEQAYAIFDYVYSNITYWEGSDKTDIKSEAYRGLTSGVGDCFTFYATTYELLQRIDCQVLSVERLNGKTQHFWCLVNLGTGWYHFDACNVGPEHLRCFMKTSDELLKYSVQYWRFDTTLYPELETRPYSRQS